MSAFPRTLFAAVVAVCLACASAHAQIRIHKTLNVEDGLVQSQVNAILEDSRGFVWLATFGGVSRWNGTTFQNFQTQDGLAAMDVRVFYEATDGAIFIGTAENGMSIYRDGHLTTFNESYGLPGNSVRAIDRAGDGALRVATGGGIIVFADESLDTTTAVRLLDGRSVSGIEKRRAGGYYASTFGDGVFLCDAGHAEPIDPEGVLPHRIIRGLYEAPDGTLFISVYKHGIWLLQDGRFRPFPHNDVLAGNDVKAFAPARDGTLYLATLGGGVGVYRPDGTLEMLTKESGLHNEISWGVHEGASGVVYIGTWNGLSLYYPGRVNTWNTAAGLPEDIVGSAAEMADGTIFVGTIGGGLVEIGGAGTPSAAVRRVITTDDGLADNRVWSLHAARDGTLFIGTHAGINTLRAGRLETLYFEPRELSGRIYAIHEAQDGTFYFGTYGGVLRLVEGEVSPLYEEKHRGRSSVYAICEGRGGEIYFGTGAGIVIYRDGRVEIPSYPPRQLADVRVWAVHEGEDGTMYFGTNGAGLHMMKGGYSPDGPVETLDMSSGLSNNTVYSVIEGSDGRLYLTTNRGLNIVDLSGEAPVVRRLGYREGLASDECNQGRAMVDSRGRIWACTNRGASCYDPASDPPSTTPPNIHITRVRLFEDDIALADFRTHGRFSHGENYFKFDFVGTNPRAPEDVIYRYRLSRIDRDWVESGQTQVQYTALPHGPYTFEVKARNEWGYWSEPAALRFGIAPPFWKTWWFFLLAAIALGGTVTLVVLNRVRHLLALERLRTKIAADLHDDIGAGLTEISIMSEVVAQKLPEAQRSAVGNELTRIATASRQLVGGMSDIVWLVNPRRDSLHDLIARLGDVYNESLRTGDVSLRVNNLESLQNVKLDMERRQHVFLIFKEAIHNALKYSGASEITLDVVANGRGVGGAIEIRVRDDGAGFDPENASNGNGLANMRGRAARIGARLSVDSAPGRGTTVSLRMRSR